MGHIGRRSPKTGGWQPKSQDRDGGKWGPYDKKPLLLHETTSERLKSECGGVVQKPRRKKAYKIISPEYLTGKGMKGGLHKAKRESS